MTPLLHERRHRSSPASGGMIAARRFSRLEIAEAVQAQALEDPADGGSRDAGFGGHCLAGHALAAQTLDAINDRLECRLTYAQAIWTPLERKRLRLR